MYRRSHEYYGPVSEYLYLKSVIDLKIYKFKITLRESDPMIWRRVLVPSTFTFFQLHGAIQDAMGWEDSKHLHQFQLNGTIIKLPRKDKRIQKLIDQVGKTSDEMYARISVPTKKQMELGIERYFQKVGDVATYIYDLNKHWEHGVELEEVAIEMEEESVYPRCTEGEGACPPEFCEGIEGYKYMLEIMQNPQHPRHDFYKPRFIFNEFTPEHVTFREQVTKKDLELIHPYKFSSSEDSSARRLPKPTIESASGPNEPAPPSSSKEYATPSHSPTRPTSQSTPKSPSSTPFKNFWPNVSTINELPSESTAKSPRTTTSENILPNVSTGTVNALIFESTPKTTSGTPLKNFLPNVSTINEATLKQSTSSVSSPELSTAMECSTPDDSDESL